LSAEDCYSSLDRKHLDEILAVVRAAAFGWLRLSLD
jgi:hypothetical protein